MMGLWNGTSISLCTNAGVGSVITSPTELTEANLILVYGNERSGKSIMERRVSKRNIGTCDRPTALFLRGILVG